MVPGSQTWFYVLSTSARAQVTEHLEFGVGSLSRSCSVSLRNCVSKYQLGWSAKEASGVVTTHLKTRCCGVHRDRRACVGQAITPAPGLPWDTVTVCQVPGSGRNWSLSRPIDRWYL